MKWVKLALNGDIDVIYFDKPADTTGIIEAPDDVAPRWTRDGSKFIPPQIDVNQAKAAKAEMLRLKCAAEITSGFTSGALGVEHKYGSDAVSQQNLTSAVTDGTFAASANWSTSIWCSVGGEWSFVGHNYTQVRQVFQDYRNHVEGKQAHLADLREAVAAANTTEELAAIDW